MKSLKTFAALLVVALASGARAEPNLQNARSLSRYQVLTYTFSTTANVSGALVGVLPQPGMVLRDVIVTQAGAGVGGTSWTATPKRGGTSLVSTAGGFTLAAGANKVTNVSGSKITSLSAPSGATRPAVSGPVAASQTITVAAGNLSAGDTVTIDGIVFTARASGATYPDFNVGAANTDTATNLAAAINGHTSVSVRAGVASNVVTVYAKNVGAGGNSLAISKSASNITLGGSNLAGGFTAPSAAGDIVTMDVTLTGTYSGAVSGIVTLFFEPQW